MIPVACQGHRGRTCRVPTRHAIPWQRELNNAADRRVGPVAARGAEMATARWHRGLVGLIPLGVLCVVVVVDALLPPAIRGDLRRGGFGRAAHDALLSIVRSWAGIERLRLAVAAATARWLTPSGERWATKQSVPRCPAPTTNWRPPHNASNGPCGSQRSLIDSSASSLSAACAGVRLSIRDACQAHCGHYRGIRDGNNLQT